MDGIVKLEQFDYFHETRFDHLLAVSIPKLHFFVQAIMHNELACMCSDCVVDGMLANFVIGLPPVLNYGFQNIYDRIVPEVYSPSLPCNL